MKESMELVFDLIKLKFDLSDLSMLPNDFNSGRFIKGGTNEKEWLKRSVIESAIEISAEVRFGIVEFNSGRYFFSTGLENPDQMPVGIDPVDNNAGLFTALVSVLELPVKESITPIHLEQYILSQNTNDSLYKGHEYTDLESIFPKIFVSAITGQYVGDPNNLAQLVCAYLALNKKFLTLPFSDATLSNISQLVLVNSSVLNYESVLQALISSQFKFAFLDLYRCLELLYQIIYVDSTYTTLGLTISKADFLQALDIELSWKPQERGSLQRLFKETPDSYRVTLIDAIKRITNNQDLNHSSWLYDLRCSIVHLKTVHKHFIIKASDWDRLINGIVYLANFWYYKYPVFE